MSSDFNKFNFHKNTFCVFREAQLPDRKPDFVSKSGSSYWFDQLGVFRNSNHWGRAARCKWRLVSTDSNSRQKTGFASWTDFHRDNEREKLYYISIENGSPNYFHANSPTFKDDFLRTAGETIKRLRQIRAFLNGNRPEDQTSVRILKLLIETDKPMWQIHAAVSHN